jgi:hypothetical protein
VDVGGDRRRAVAPRVCASVLGPAGEAQAVASRALPRHGEERGRRQGDFAEIMLPDRGGRCGWHGVDPRHAITSADSRSRDLRLAVRPTEVASRHRDLAADIDRGRQQEFGGGSPSLPRSGVGQPAHGVRERCSWLRGRIRCRGLSPYAGSASARTRAASLMRWRPYWIEGAIWQPGDATCCPTSGSSRRRAGRAAADTRRYTATAVTREEREGRRADPAP